MIRSLVRVLLVRPAFAVRCGAWLLFVTLVAILLHLGSKPEVGGLFPTPWDKLAHLLFFGGLAGLALIGQGGRYPLLAVLMIAVFGVADEIGQSFNPARVASAADWSMDLLGACAAMFVALRLQRWAGAAKPGQR